jgi:hypothetical protein
MSDQAKKFLAQWELEHIEVVPRSDREEQARRLALQCRQDAVNAGLSDQELEAVAEGNLSGICSETTAWPYSHHAPRLTLAGV